MIITAAEIKHMRITAAEMKRENNSNRDETYENNSSRDETYENNSSRDETYENNSRIHFDRYKTNTEIDKELNITPVLEKLQDCKRKRVLHVNRMPRNR
jgi:hypothetical protein